MTDDDDWGDEDFEDEMCVLDLKALKPQPASLHLDRVIDETLLSLRPDIKLKRWNSALKIYKDGTKFLVDFMESLFWLVHLLLHRPQDKSLISSYSLEVGKKWTNFIFPLEIDSGHNQEARDSFIISFPYFATQVIQKVFMHITHGNPITQDQKIRLDICKNCIKIFTAIEPMDAQLTRNLFIYFNAPPEVFFDDERELQEIQKEQKERNEVKAELQDDNELLVDVKLPIEDLSTLIEMQRRKRPISKLWNMSGVSTMIHQSTNHKSVPFEHDANIVIQYPEGGEEDWTTKLPPLLPSTTSANPALKSDIIANISIKDKYSTQKRSKLYDPMQDSRSLLHRSRRPDVCEKVSQMKEQFILNQEVQSNHQIKLMNDLAITRKRLLSSDKCTVDKFLLDLRNMQMSHKRNETPELPEEKISAKIAPTQNNNSLQPSARKTQEEKDIELRERLAESKRVAREQAEILRAAHDDCISNSDNMPKPKRGFIVSTVDYKPSKVLVDDVVAGLIDKRRAKEAADIAFKIAQKKERTRMAEAELAARDATRSKLILNHRGSSLKY